MQTYYMLGKYSTVGVKHIAAVRSESCIRMIEDLGGEIILLDALLGEYDLAIIGKFPDNTAALRATLALEKLTELTLKTLPAISVAEFDQLALEI